MRPVDERYKITQGFAEGATAGVAPNKSPKSGVGYLVYLYGNYQPLGHAGTDLGTPVGTPVRASRSGTVLWCDWDVNLPGDDSWGPSGYFQRWGFYRSFGGRLLVIQHAPGDLDVYAHLSEFKVKKGQFVNEGDLVALSGDSSGGKDEQLGPHLHTERIVDTDNYSSANGMIYGRIDPSTAWGGISAQGSIQEDEELKPEQMQELKDFIYKTVGTMLQQYHDATRSTVVKQVNEAADKRSYADRVFNQEQANKNGDRVINFLKAGK